MQRGRPASQGHHRATSFLAPVYIELLSLLLQFCSHKNTLSRSMGVGDAWLYRKVAKSCRTCLHPISEDELQWPMSPDLPWMHS